MNRGPLFHPFILPSFSPFIFWTYINLYKKEFKLESEKKLQVKLFSEFWKRVLLLSKCKIKIVMERMYNISYFFIWVPTGLFINKPVRPSVSGLYLGIRKMNVYVYCRYNNNKNELNLKIKGVSY